MAYTPPAADEVDFSFTSGYTPPAGDNVILNFGIPAVVTLESVSRSTIYDESVQAGFNQTVVRWSSDLTGPYRIEVGGTGAESGDLISSGNTFADFIVRNVIDDSDVEDAATFSGTGEYRVNIYVYNEDDDIWTPYQ